MYKYTTTLEGDEIVSKDIEKIKKAVKGEKFESLVLYGSFGKGEGLVLDKPRNDYDILLVGGNHKLKEKLENLKTKCPVEVLHLQTNDIRDISCNQQWFEIKYASQLLAGKPLDLPNWQPYDIPYIDAINSLERRSLSMLVGKYEMTKEKPDRRKITEQIAKGIIAVGDATLIKRGQFHPKYSIRALMLSQDDIGGLYSLAVSTKLTGLPDLNPDQQWDLWHRTRNTMRQYAIDNQLSLVIGEALFAVTDRTTPEQLKDLITKLGAEKWL